VISLQLVTFLARQVFQTRCYAKDTYIYYEEIVVILEKQMGDRQVIIASMKK